MRVLVTVSMLNVKLVSVVEIGCLKVLAGISFARIGKNEGWDTSL